MRTLSKVGWFCLALGIAAVALTFIHYGGMENSAIAVMRMFASVFWGGITLAGVFLVLMALLFLNA